MMIKRLHLVCYDIADDDVRLDFYNKTKDYALDGQKSAYECWLSHGDKQHLITFANHIQNEKQTKDGFLIIRAYRHYWQSQPKDNPMWQPNHYLIYIG